MSALLEILASFVPTLVIRRANVDPGQIVAPTVEKLPAAVLFADVAGFTALTERLAARGHEGVEDLTLVLNAYFGRLIDVVSDYGGDTVKFAGDALLAIWPGGDEEDLPSLALRVSQCGLDIQARLHDYEVAEGIRLSVKVALGAGEIVVEHLGGVFERTEMLVAGEPLAQVGICNDLACPETWCCRKTCTDSSPIASRPDHGGKAVWPSNRSSRPSPSCPKKESSPLPNPSKASGGSSRRRFARASTVASATGSASCGASPFCSSTCPTSTIPFRSNWLSRPWSPSRPRSTVSREASTRSASMTKASPW